MKRYPLVRVGIVLLLGVIAAFYLLFLVGSVYEAAVFPPAPQRVTLAQAAALERAHQPDFLVFGRTLHVAITDAVWECASVNHTGYQSILRDRRRTDAVFTDAAGSAVVFVQLDGFFTCAELQECEISGELQRITARPITYASDARGEVTLDLQSKTRVYRFCTHCNLLHALLLPVSLAILPFILWGGYRYWKRL